MGNSDVSFTIDPQEFLTAITKMNKALDSMLVNTKTVAENTGESLSKVSSFMVMKGMLMAQGFIAIAKKVVNQIKANIPELGQAFGYAADIFWRNFTFPLRQELLPLLRKMLDWVRDHRMMFARWGSYVVSVFRAIKAVVLSGIEMVQRLWEKIAGVFERVFGKTKNSVSDVINLIIFKLAFFAQVLMVVAEEIADFFIKTFEVLLGWINKIGQGIASAFESFDISDVVSGFKELLDAMKELVGQGTLLNDTFKLLGTIIGGAVRLALNVIMMAVDFIADKLRRLSITLDLLSGKINSDEAERRYEKQQQRYEESTKRRLKDMGNTLGDVSEGVMNTVAGDDYQYSKVNLKKAEERVKNIDNSRTEVPIEINLFGTNATVQEVEKVVTKAVKEGLNKSGGSNGMGVKK